MQFPQNQLHSLTTSPVKISQPRSHAILDISDETNTTTDSKTIIPGMDREPMQTKSSAGTNAFNGTANFARYPFCLVTACWAAFLSATPSAGDRLLLGVRLWRNVFGRSWAVDHHWRTIAQGRRMFFRPDHPPVLTVHPSSSSTQLTHSPNSTVRPT